MAGGFGNKKVEKKQPSNTKGSTQKNDVPIDSKVSTSANTVAQKAILDVKQIVDVLDENEDPFWQLIEPLLLSEYNSEDIQRVLGFIKYSTGKLPLPDSIVLDKWRPHEDIHAFMDGIPAEPFRDKTLYPFVAELEANYPAIRAEFEALQANAADRFQSVTSMNYASGWQTLVLYFNGHRIDGFPYHLCPVTTSILDKIPVAGRIAGFNRQAPGSGIPLHSDGNNIWLTCQLGVHVPQGETAWIRVGPETRHWAPGKCLVYDTTFEHETFNPSQEERVVLHVDYWNFGALTPVEIKAMQRVYSLREMYLRAEGLVDTGGRL